MWRIRVESDAVSSEFQKSLLNAVSHNLRAPLASITGVLDSLMADRDRLDEQTQRELLESAREQADRLNRLIGNLLDMTRLEGGAIHLRAEPWDVQDVVDAAFVHLGDHRLPGRTSVNIPPDLPPVSMDFALITQTLVNILDNALKYSGDGLPIEIHARLQHNRVHIAVADRGKGIAPVDLPRVFEKFYSGAPNGTGIGLGLSICKGLVEAHGGSIWAENRQDGGAVITFTLPVDRAGGDA
jgi:two-component system sensor histidine kinase KdpD